MTVWMQDCYSSNIAQVGYDDVEQGMLVKFAKSGQTYFYPGVTEEEAKQLANAPSVGSEFHAVYKNREFRKL